MTPSDIDPSLRAAEPLLESLEDGFSPPIVKEAQQDPAPSGPQAAAPAEPQLGAKSPF